MDASRVSQHSVKLKKLLDAILRANGRISSDASFDALLFHLSGKENPDLASSLLSLDFFAEWIVEACAFWEENENTCPPVNVGRFVLELTALISKNEERFAQLSGANAFLRLCDAFRVRKSGCVPSIKLAYVKLLQSFLEHKSGVEWIRATNSWFDILNYTLTPNPHPEVLRESYNFVYNLLEGRVDFDETFCDNITKRIMQPLAANSLLNTTNCEIDEEHLKTKVQPTLRLLVAILERYLKNEWSNKRYQHIPKVFLNNHGLLQIVATYLILVTDEDLSFDFSHVAFLIYVIALCVESKEHMITEHESIPAFEKLFLLIEEAITKKHCWRVLKLSQLAIEYWFLIHTRLLPMTHNKDMNKDPLRFQNQIVILQAMPIFQFFEDCFKLDWNLEGLDDLRDSYMDKVCRQMCEYTIRLAYNYRDALIAASPCDYKTALRALNYIVLSRKHYEHEAAVVMFQALVYVLHDIVEIAKIDAFQLAMAQKEPEFFLMNVLGIRDLIQNFDIKWPNCVESICVVNVALDLLLLTTWPAKLTIETLKLLELSIRKYMSPNLALLVDRTSDSSVGQLGPLLVSKLKEAEWEIRDNCLGVLTAISELAHSKFPSFQETLLKESFPSTVLNLCLEDPESFVRASALKCLQHMVQSSVLWDEFFEAQDLPRKIMRILSNETEGIVRLEAVSLTRILYLHHGFAEEKMPQIYELMGAAVTVDMHWEVKRKALEFWDDVIWERLRNQGMIDGKFPQVTFSKENRKIVTLNDCEIKRRLNIVLVELNASGCLALLKRAIQEDCDVEVVEKAAEVTKKFVVLLNRYYKKKDDPRTPHHCFDLKLNEENEGIGQFCDLVLQQGLDRAVEIRKKWLGNTDAFGTLLDDMLRDYEDDEDMNSNDFF